MFYIGFYEFFFILVMHNRIKELTGQKMNQPTGSIKSKERSLIIEKGKNISKMERICQKRMQEGNLHWKIWKSWK